MNWNNENIKIILNINIINIIFIENLEIEN
jgi:hypothetical protein